MNWNNIHNKNTKTFIAITNIRNNKKRNNKTSDSDKSNIKNMKCRYLL